MEPTDVKIIEQNTQDQELQGLWQLHVEYKQRLEKLGNKPYLTPAEETEVKELKKKKLAGKTKLQLVLDRYKD